MRLFGDCIKSRIVQVHIRPLTKHLPLIACKGIACKKVRNRTCRLFIVWDLSSRIMTETHSGALWRENQRMNKDRILIFSKFLHQHLRTI